MAAINSLPGAIRETKNPFERTLWIVTAVLLVGPCIALAWSHAILMSRFQGWSGNEPPMDLQIAQLVNTFAPSALTGGIVLGGMALAIRALSFDRRLDTTQGVPASGGVIADESGSAAPRPVIGGKAPLPSHATDHTPYMRPQGGTQG